MFGNKDDELVIEVTIHTRHGPSSTRKHAINQDEAREFGLVPLPRPLPGDIVAEADYVSQKKRRDDLTRRVGEMIAFDIQRYLEDEDAQT